MHDSDTVEWVTLIVAIVGLGTGLWQYRAARRRQLLIDVQQGDKSTVAYVAMQVSNGHYSKRNARQRQELFQALCLAAVFGKSGRSMALIHGALASVARITAFKKELRKIVDDTTVAIARSSGYTDLQHGQRRLNSLRATLRLDGDVRLRLDTYELRAPAAERGLAFLPTASRTFINDLGPAIKRQGSLVVVIPDGRPNDRVVSLGFDRPWGDVAAAAWESVSAKLNLAKSGQPGEPSETTIAWIASRLVATIRAIPEYKKATVIASVDGTFSSRLGDAVAKELEKHANDTVKKRLVRLTIERSTVPPEAKGAKGAMRADDKVIVLDDLYRSGDTLLAAFNAVRETNAKPVGGLTAICTVSPATPPAVDRCGA